MAHAERKRVVTPSGHPTGYYVDTEQERVVTPSGHSTGYRVEQGRVVTRSGHSTGYRVEDSSSSKIPRIEPGTTQLTRPKMDTRSTSVRRQPIGEARAIGELGGAISNMADTIAESCRIRNLRDAPLMQEQIDKGLSLLQGQNIQTAINVLGHPSKKQKHGSTTVYSWSNNIYFLSGNNCTIKLYLNENGIIESSEWEGTVEGSRKYAKKLDRYCKQDIKFASSDFQNGLSEQEAKDKLRKNAGSSFGVKYARKKNKLPEGTLQRVYVEPFTGDIETRKAATALFVSGLEVLGFEVINKRSLYKPVNAVETQPTQVSRQGADGIFVGETTSRFNEMLANVWVDVSFIDAETDRVIWHAKRGDPRWIVDSASPEDSTPYSVRGVLKKLKRDLKKLKKKSRD